MLSSTCWAADALAACTQITISNLTLQSEYTIRGTNKCYSFLGSITGNDIFVDGAMSSTLTRQITISNYGSIQNNQFGIVVDGGAQADVIKNYGSITIAPNPNSLDPQWSLDRVGVAVDYDYNLNTSTYFRSSINLFENSGTLSVTGGRLNAAAFSTDSNSTSTILNSGQISASSTDADSSGISNAAGFIGNLNNSNLISAATVSGPLGAAGIANYDTGAITTLTNSGTIIGIVSNSQVQTQLGAAGVANFSQATIGTLNNSGSITGSSENSPYNLGTGVFNYSGTITSLINSGTISGTSTSSQGYGIYNNLGMISSLKNTGTISGSTTGIYNAGGTITSLTNGQGSSSGSSLSLIGNLPTNYSIILNSQSSYGRLSYYKGSAGSSSLSSLTFSIDPSSFIEPGVYRGVLMSRSSDFTASGTAFSGTPTLVSFAGITYTLTSSDGGISYNLNIRSIEIEQGSSKDLSKTNNATINGGTLVVDSTGTFNSSFKIGNSGNNTIDANGKTATISGIISDATNAGNVKFSSSTNTGRVILSGNNTYTGTTEVANGVVVSVNGSIASSSQLTVANGGTVGGNGQLPKTNVGSGGTLAPGNSIGTLNVFGDLSFANGSTYTVELNNAGQSDKIITTGKVLISDNTTLSLVPDSGTYSSSTIFALLTSSGGISGKFSSVTSSIPSLTPKLTYEGSSLFLRFINIPSSANTLSAINALARTTRNLVSSRAFEIGNTSSYDCETFDKHGVCLSYQARFSRLNEMNDGAGVLIGSYSPSANLRYGAFVDYRASAPPSGGIKVDDTLPTFGLFVGYKQAADDTGLQLRGSLAFNQDTASFQRNSALANTEAGSGKSKITSYAMTSEIGWSLKNADYILTTFGGIQYQGAARRAYSEIEVIGSVDSPLSLKRYSEEAWIGTIGIRFAGSLGDKIVYRLGAGVDYDLSRSSKRFLGTSEIMNLETFDVDVGRAVNRLRGFGSFGASYLLAQDKRLTTNLSLRGQPYSSGMALNVMSGYQMSF